jgi:RNA recognition motif-containing protein
LKRHITISKGKLKLLSFFEGLVYSPITTIISNTRPQKMKRSNDGSHMPSKDGGMKRMRVNHSGTAYNMGGGMNAVAANGGYGQGSADPYNQFGAGGMNQFVDQSGGMGAGVPGMMGMAGSFNGFGQFGAGQAGMGGNMGGFQGAQGFGGQQSMGGFGGGNQFMGAGVGGAQFMQAPANNNSPTNRTVYFGSLPPGTTVEEVLSNVKGGAIEQARMLDEKNCAFITFVEAPPAFNFFNECQGKPIIIGGQQVKIGWGKPSFCHPSVLTAYHAGATRNVYIGNIDEVINEQVLMTELSKFGPIDQIKILHDKKCAFIHMTSLSNAIKAVQTLPSEPLFAGKRVNYGKDRCNPFAQQHGNAQQQGVDSFSGGGGGGGGGAQGVPAHRTLYIGGIQAEATMKDICDVSLLTAVLGDKQRLKAHAFQFFRCFSRSSVVVSSSTLNTCPTRTARSSPSSILPLPWLCITVVKLKVSSSRASVSRLAGANPVSSPATLPRPSKTVPQETFISATSTALSTTKDFDGTFLNSVTLKWSTF